MDGDVCLVIAVVTRTFGGQLDWGFEGDKSKTTTAIH